MHYKINNLNKLTHQDQEQALRNVPKNTTSLDLSDNHFSGLNTAQLKKIITAIGPKVTRLDLSGNFLANKSLADIIEVLQSIPATIKYLNLGRNCLDKKNGDQIAQILASIPESVTHLNLGGNDFGNMIGHEIAQALKDLGPNVIHLDLEFNQLDKKSNKEWDEILASIPNTVKSLGLGKNQLGKRNHANLGHILATIGPNITTLDLGGNYLNEKCFEQLKTIFVMLPKTISAINLSDNSLVDMNSEHLSEALRVLKHVKSINLSTNRLGEYKNANLHMLINALPESIERVYLANNNLAETPANELENAFSKFSPNLTFIDLSGNEFLKLKRAEFAKALNSLPSTVSQVNLKSNGLEILAQKTALLITQELNRLKSAKSDNNNFWVYLGIVKASDAKIKALEGLKNLLDKGYSSSSINFHQELIKWKTNNLSTLSEQRNAIHTFFAPAHKTHSSSVVEEVYGLFGIEQSNLQHPQVELTL